MSATLMGMVFAVSESTGNDRIVLLAIADEADDDGTHAFPSLQRLSHKARVPVRTVQRSLERLVELGEVRVERPEIKGRGYFNRYFVLVENLRKKQVTMTTFARTNVAEGGGTFHARHENVIDPLTHRPSSSAPESQSASTAVDNEVSEEELLRIEAKNRLAARDPSLPTIHDTEKWITTTMASLREERRAARDADHKRRLRIARERGEFLVRAGLVEEVDVERSRYAGAELAAFDDGVDTASRSLDATG